MSVAETAAAPMAPALKVLAEMSPVREKDIIPLLQRLQEQYGYLPREVILEVAARAGLPASRIYGVATFYAQFRLHAERPAHGPLLPRHGLPRQRRKESRRGGAERRWASRKARPPRTCGSRSRRWPASAPVSWRRS